MFDLDRWEEIWATISRNKMRSFFTGMGIFWGIFMLVVMLGSGLGLERYVSIITGNVATNSCFFYTNPTSKPYKGFRSGRSWSFKTDDLNILKNNIKEIENISAIAFGQSVTAIRGDKKGSYSTIGHMPQYQFMEPQVMTYGRYINEIDMNEKRKVCMIGIQIYKELFNHGENPVGHTIQINGTYFTVIGVNEAMGDISFFSDPPNTITIPFSTMQQMYNRGDNVDFLAVTGTKDVAINDLESSITDILKSRHSISPEDTKAINNFNIRDIFEMYQNLFTGINLLTWIVGLGTLLAGIVGISNIMLVVVRERTQEIGVRRALGAPPRAIIAQIISESFVLTFVAGVIGLAMGVGVLSVADSIIIAQTTEGLPFSVQISFSAAIIAASVLIIGGLCAGIIPANRALSIKPVDAIREE